MIKIFKLNTIKNPLRNSDGFEILFTDFLFNVQMTGFRKFFWNGEDFVNFYKYSRHYFSLHAHS